MTRLLNRLFGAHTPVATKPARRVLLSVESLECRETPSGVRLSFDTTNDQSRENALRSIAEHSSHSNVMKKVQKLHALTLKNLSPDNYSH